MTIFLVLAFARDLACVLVVTVFLYLLPGLGVTTWLGRSRSLAWSEHLTLAPGISLALYSLFFLWAYTLGVKPNGSLAWALPAVGATLSLWFNREKLRGLGGGFNLQWLKLSPKIAPDLTLLLLIGLLFASRFSPIRFLTEPFWGDSVHHTFITQLIVDNGGLFQSWEPYAPIRSLTYHFGFHVVVAQWIWLTGIPTPEAVLVVGQVFNGLAVLALYPLALRVGDGNRWTGVGAVIVAGFLLTMPAYYVNWGRYTQLTGQVILPALIWLFVMVWDEYRRPNRIFWSVAIVLAAGLVVTHYRVAVLAGAAGVGWALWGIWTLRQRRSEVVYRLFWLISVSIAAGGLILPWVSIVRGGAMEDLFSRVAQRNMSNPALVQDMALWLADVPRYYPTYYWIGAILFLLLALWKKRSLSVPLLLWAAFTFLATNPFLIRLPGTGWVSNFLVIIALYIPLALFWGWAAGAGTIWLWGKRFGPWLVGILLIGLLGWGTLQQVRVVDFFYRMVWPSDRVAFDWIEANTSPDSHFLINSFSVYSGVLVVGSDGGWWLPFFTRRTATVPPASYFTEQNSEPGFIQRVANFDAEVLASKGEPSILTPILCQEGVTHVYLGERRGTVGFGANALVPEGWLVSNPAFSLLFQEGAAQVWSFDRGVCGGD